MMRFSQVLGAATLLSLSACHADPEPVDSELIDAEGQKAGEDSGLASADSGDPSGDSGGPSIDTGVQLGPELLATGALNLVLINVDTLRADHLPMYGYARQTLPRLSRRPWRVVDGLHGNSSWTAHGTASLITGLDVIDHGVRYPVTGAERGPVVDRLSEGGIAEHLQDLGFDTVLLSGNEFVANASGLARGFDAGYMHFDEGEGTNTRLLADEALGWLDSREGSSPFFIMLQPMDMHDPYQAPAPFRGTWQDPEALLFSVDGDPLEQMLQLETMGEHADDATLEVLGAQLGAVYDEELLALDEGLARLLDGLEARDLLRQTLVVFTSDHGEALLDTDNRLLGHGKAISPEVLHLPLMFLHPGMVGTPERCLSAQADVMPTALAAMGLAPMPGATGRPLQEGCRTHGISSFLGEEGVTVVASWDETRLLRKDCGFGDERWFDLASDPYAERPRLVSELPSDDPLIQARDAWLHEYLDRYGDRSCL